MKICSKCGLGTEFYTDRHSWCKACKRADTNRWRRANIERKKAADAARYAGIRRRVMDLKLTIACVDCGWRPFDDESTSRLEFDHIDPMTKAHFVNRGAAFSYSWSWERIKREMALCEPRCVDCHRKRTTQLGHRHMRKRNAA